jgi:hypothetical protein
MRGPQSLDQHWVAASCWSSGRPDRGPGIPVPERGGKIEIDQLVIAGVGLDRFIRFEVAPYRTTERTARSKRAKSRTRPSRWRWKRIDQTCRGLSASFGPIKQPLFHGLLAKVCRSVEFVMCHLPRPRRASWSVIKNSLESAKGGKRT